MEVGTFLNRGEARGGGDPCFHGFNTQPCTQEEKQTETLADRERDTYKYIHTDTDTDTDSDTGRKRDRHTDRHTDRCAHTHIHTLKTHMYVCNIVVEV